MMMGFKKLKFYKNACCPCHIPSLRHQLGANANSCLGISGLSIRSRRPAGNRWSRSVTPPRASRKLPKAEHDAEEWQAAMQALLLVVQHGGPPRCARIGIIRALNRGYVREFNTSRKDTHWGRRKLARNQ